MTRYFTKITLKSVALFSMAVWFSTPAFAGICESSLSALYSRKSARSKLELEFPAQQRIFQVLEYNLEPARRERNRDKIVRLVYALIDTDQKHVIWSFEEYPKHMPSAGVLDPTDPNSIFIAKPVERFYPIEEAPTHSSPHKNYPGLSSDIIFEVLNIRRTKDGIIQKDIFDSTSPIIGLSIENDQLTIKTQSDTRMIKVNP